jgi:hypothetical protein
VEVEQAGIRFTDDEWMRLAFGGFDGIERNGGRCSASEPGIGRMSSGVPPRLRPTSLVAPPGRIIYRRTDHESWSPTMTKRKPRPANVFWLCAMPSSLSAAA